ncbi:DUF4123 domain-containing protein [Halomonas aquamarina]|uniref:DUF4123 domain-containing protein n=1 Tax=Vreelandella aquamarina TaxID=77097 RepID=A0ACC5VXN6_9GAMM|nr:DUF4123 domain-containing protein [Halomonas aquamarina]MBZ5488996.1 DUF4123 domain-containing protein [Halomonas aquamarina]
MSELLSASRIDDIEPNHALPCWLVVDRYPGILERIYQLEPSPQLAFLFHETKYASLEEYSPLVVRIERGSALWHAYSQQQDTAFSQGVLIMSEATEQAVLKYLRQRLEIHFYGSRKALFRFYDSCIASVFFSADSVIDRWLGPLERVVWFGGTWVQIAEHGKQWYSCVGQPHQQLVEGQYQDEEPYKLSPSQEQAMENFVLVQAVWRKWSKQKRAKASSGEDITYFVQRVSASMRLELPREHLQKVLEIFLTLTPGEWLAGVSELPAVNRLQEIERRAENTSQSKTRSFTI